jgi:hypothetical protein
MSRNKIRVFTDDPAPSPKYELFRVTENHFKEIGVMGVQDELIPQFEFYNDKVRQSKKLDEIKFTNFVTDRISTDILIRLQELASNPSIIKDDADVTNLNAKIESCLRLYVDRDVNTEQIFKSTLKTDLGVKTTVRVFSIVDLKRDDSGRNVAIFRIGLIDPFHLVIPSKHLKLTKEQMEEKVFRENRNNTVCLSKFCKSIFE